MEGKIWIDHSVWCPTSVSGLGRGSSSRSRSSLHLTSALNVSCQLTLYFTRERLLFALSRTRASPILVHDRAWSSLRLYTCLRRAPTQRRTTSFLPPRSWLGHCRLGQMIPTMLAVAASCFRNSAPLVPWTDAELQQLYCIWLQVERAAWRLPSGFPSVPLTLSRSPVTVEAALLLIPGR